MANYDSFGFVVQLGQSGVEIDAVDKKLAALGKQAEATAVQTAKVEKAAKAAGKSTFDAGQAALQASYAFQDLAQGGLAATLNNAPGIITALGAGPGLTGILGGVAVAALFLKDPLLKAAGWIDGLSEKAEAAAKRALELRDAFEKLAAAPTAQAANASTTFQKAVVETGGEPLAKDVTEALFGSDLGAKMTPEDIEAIRKAGERQFVVDPEGLAAPRAESDEDRTQRVDRTTREVNQRLADENARKAREMIAQAGGTGPDADLARRNIDRLRLANPNAPALGKFDPITDMLNAEGQKADAEFAPIREQMKADAEKAGKAIIAGANAAAAGMLGGFKAGAGIEAKEGEAVDKAFAPARREQATFDAQDVERAFGGGFTAQEGEALARSNSAQNAALAGHGNIGDMQRVLQENDGILATLDAQGQGMSQAAAAFIQQQAQLRQLIDLMGQNMQIQAEAAGQIQAINGWISNARQNQQVTRTRLSRGRNSGASEDGGDVEAQVNELAAAVFGDANRDGLERMMRRQQARQPTTPDLLQWGNGWGRAPVGAATAGAVTNRVAAQVEELRIDALLNRMAMQINPTLMSRGDG